MPGYRRFAPRTSTRSTASCAECGGRNGDPLTPGTVHRIHVVLHRALAQALRWEWLWVNPAASASPPSCEPGTDPSAEPGRGRPTARPRCRPSIPTSTVLVARRFDRSSTQPARGAALERRRPRERDRSASSTPSSMRKAVRCCVQPRPDAPIGSTWTATAFEVLVAHHARARHRAELLGRRHRPLGLRLLERACWTIPWRPNWVTKRFITYRKAAKVNCRLHDLRHFMATTMLTAGSRSRRCRLGSATREPPRP